MLAVGNSERKWLKIAAITVVCYNQCGDEVACARMCITMRTGSAIAAITLGLLAASSAVAQRRPPPLGTAVGIRGRQVESAAASRRPAWNSTVVAPGKDSPAVAIQQIRAERQQQQEALRAEAEQLLQRGASAEQLGKAGVARIYYQMVARRASGQLKEKALARLASIGTAQTD
jgi:hypothetical protein